MTTSPLKGWPFARILDEQVDAYADADADQISQLCRNFPAEAIASVALRRAFTGVSPCGPWIPGTPCDHTGIGTSTTSIAPNSGPALSISTVSGLYEIEALLIVDSSSTAGLKAGTQAAGGNVTFQAYAEMGDTSSAAAVAGNTAGSVGGTSFATAISTKSLVWLKGIAKFSGSGTIVAQISKTTSGTCGCYAGSLLRARKLA